MLWVELDMFKNCLIYNDRCMILSWKIVQWRCWLCQFENIKWWSQEAFQNTCPHTLILLIRKLCSRKVHNQPKIFQLVLGKMRTRTHISLSKCGCWFLYVCVCVSFIWSHCLPHQNWNLCNKHSHSLHLLNKININKIKLVFSNFFIISNLWHLFIVVKVLFAFIKSKEEAWCQLNHHTPPAGKNN